MESEFCDFLFFVGIFFPKRLKMTSPNSTAGDKRENVICLMTDRMNIGLLGAYGSSYVETPAFDRLAFESVLFDQYGTSTLDLDRLYEAFWTGADPTQKDSRPSEPLAERFARAGYQTILLTDAQEIAFSPAAAHFDRVERLESSASNRCAETVEETAFFAFFAQTADLIETARKKDQPIFLWGRCAGFGGAWDFPLSIRSLFVEDQQDPPAYEGESAPFFEWARPTKKKNAADDALPDYDRVQAVVEAYAGGMSVWDRALESLLGWLRAESFWDTTHFILGSERGFPLGEHGRVGTPASGEPIFYAEELHLPLLWRRPSNRSASVRPKAPVGPDDLYRTLRAIAASDDDRKPTLEDLAEERCDLIRPYVPVAERGAESLRRGLLTPEWFFALRMSAESPDSETAELYVRPDDRWDVNEVSSRCADSVTTLRALLDKHFKSET